MRSSPGPCRERVQRPKRRRNLQQIVSPAATAAFTHLRARKVEPHKKMTRAYLRSVLAKQAHKTHKSKHHK